MSAPAAPPPAASNPAASAEGYRTDVAYTFGYYPELNPLRADFLLACAGFACPPVATACELGYGQGVSVNLHAAASACKWYGTDVNPDHAGLAQAFAAASGAGARLAAAGFADFCQRPDLPDFDCIALHGVWSWVSADNRAVIVDFVRRKLKPGGVLYVSYNAMPGQAAMGPLRHLLAGCVDAAAASSADVLTKVGEAIDFVDRLFAVEPPVLLANPGLAQRFGRLQGKDRRYLVHEYLNREWQPMYFADMAGCFAPAGLSHAACADFVDHVERFNLTDEQQALLRGIPDAVFRESVRDFMLNRQFRRDYWVRGARRLSAPERIENLRRHRFVLVSDRADIRLELPVPRGRLALSVANHQPIIDLMADHKVRTLGEIDDALGGERLASGQLLAPIIALAQMGCLAPAQDETAAAAAQAASDRANRWVLDHTLRTGEALCMASPVTGGGVPVNLLQQLFLHAQMGGERTPEAWAGAARALMDARGWKLRSGSGDAPAVAHDLETIRDRARVFASKRLPLLRALRVVPG